ncbi:MAG: UDP-glucuronic acid decarboxylase family protein [Acidobacteriota bacterium]|jgi:dTDP-glucose 4,6-dehydratase
MRIVLTGGAGFIGSHLADRLIAEGHEVVAVDNLITGYEENIRHLLANPNFSFINQDISQPFEVAGPVDWVLNLASPASPIDYLRLPLETLRVGSFGTHHTLDLARAKGARYLLTSTSEVYGDPQVHPQPESYWGNVNPNGPRSVYDEAKRYAEAATMAYHREFGLDIRIVRIFNTYGPRNRVDDGRVVPTFINQALRNEPLTVFGEGRQTRSFQYVDDLVEGLRLLMERGDHQPVNIGNPNEMTILQFARLIIELTGSASEIVYRPLPQDDPQIRQPDITRARGVLGWEPRVPVELGIRRTIDWYRSRIA